MDRQQYLNQKRWGIFTHYLAVPAGDGTGDCCSAEDWNDRINHFQPDLLAEQLSKTGADYFCITIGQNSGHYLSPNPVYDRLTDITPSKCSQRDLINDIADALSPYGIDLWVYLPSGAPCAEMQAVQKLEWESDHTKELGPDGSPTAGKRLASFQRKWESVIREWSLRWGDKVKGWWIDGCYFPEDMYYFPEEPNFYSLASALRAGNPDAVVAFNRGLDFPFSTMCEYDDFTAGEIGEQLPIPSDQDLQKLNGKRLHGFSYLGDTWGSGSPRFPDELAIGYSKLILQKGGMMTWDIPLKKNGEIPDAFLKQLTKIGAALNQSK